MTLNGVIALILRYFTEFDRLRGQLRHSDWRQTYKVRYRISSSTYILAKTDPSSSRTVSATAELIVYRSFWCTNAIAVRSAETMLSAHTHGNQCLPTLLLYPTPNDRH